MINESVLRKDYQYFKNEALKQFEKSNYEDSLDCIRTACSIAKSYYLLYQDEELEVLSEKISKVIFEENKIKKNTEKWVFYDTHTTDNIALTQQYLQALLSWNSEFLYITSRNLDTPNTKLIKAMLLSSPRVSVCEIPNTLSYVDTAKYIYKKIVAYRPERALIQTTSDDVAGIIAWYALDYIERFYIDLSDYSYWLGSRAFDYYVTFRSYGYNICVQHRKISKGKILLQPFYPIMSSKEYKGIPNEYKSGMVKLFSGGRIEKIFGKDDQYFKLVKNILIQNPNAVFYFAGGGAFGKVGQKSYIDKTLKKLGITERFYVLGFRDDIATLMEHMDIYIGTYPVGGGLMTQIAASCGMPIIQYATNGLSDHLDEFLIPKKQMSQIVFDDEDEYYEAVSKSISECELRYEQGETLQSAIITMNEFNNQLEKAVNLKKSSYVVKEYPVDCVELRNNQIDVENHCMHKYPSIMFRSAYLKRHRPFVYFYYLLRIFLFSDQKWFLTNFKMYVGKEFRKLGKLFRIGSSGGG